jgi:O-antigen ligase/Tfp pilus assembly protein PilF
MSYKIIKIILQTLLLSVIAIIPFVKIDSLYFPFVSGKVYGFRLLVCVAFFFWVWLMLKKEKGKPEVPNHLLPYKNILVAGLLLFFLAQIVVSIFSVSPALSFFSTIERQDGVIQYGFWVLYFLMLLYAFKSQKDWKIFFSVFIVSAFCVSSYAWINYKTQLPARLSGIFGNPSYLAAYLLFAIGFCFICIERKFFKNKFINILLWLAPLFFAITLFFTQTRGAYLGLAGAVFLFCFLSVLFLRPDRNAFGKADAGGKQNKKLVVGCAIILAVGVIVVAGLFLVKNTNFVKNQPLLSRITEVTQFWKLSSISDRLLNWQIALKAFAEKPIFGYGPENFMVASNKYYDFRIGIGDPWFDRTHNILLEPLATGGIVLFSTFLFLLVSAYYTIFKISKKEKMLSFILGSVLLAYLIQGMFLFDALPIYLGLFPFLAFVVYAYKASSGEKLQNFQVGGKTESKPSSSILKWQKPILVITALICLFGIQTTVYLPYTASVAAIKFLSYTDQGYYKQAQPFAKEAFHVNSPYTYWEIRKRVGWQFLNTIDGDTKFTDQEVKDLGGLYDFIVPQLERFAQNRPNDPQIYYVLPRIYRLGYQKLGKNDLAKAEALLEKGFTYSNTRIEYYNEMAQDLLLQGKFSEGEKLLKDYANRMVPLSFDYFPSWLMGNYYYVAGKYDLAMENYIKAKDKGYNFFEDPAEYSRYLDSAQQTKNYQEIVDMATKYLQISGPNADTYFNIALGDYYLGDKAKAKEFFAKALELDKGQYQQYESFFSN